MVGALLVFVTLRPCLPFETGATPAVPPAVEAPPPPPSAPPVARPLPTPLATAERARYRIAYGPLEVGELSLSLSPLARAGAAGGGSLVRATGQGSGGVLGLGRLDTRVETQFDAEQLTPRRWTSTRTQDGRATRDAIEQPAAGRLELARSRDGGPVARTQAMLAAPAFDPLGLLLRFRTAPPTQGGRPEVLDLMDGQAHWRVTIAYGRRELRDGRPSVRLEGRAEPIYSDGRPDGGRTPRTFSLWLSDDAAHVPLALEMPVGISDLVVSLVQVERPARLTKPWWAPALFARYSVVPRVPK